MIERVALFKRRGLGDVEAAAWANRLAVRDSQEDRRRSCVECAHARRDGTCAAFKPDIDPIFAPLRLTMMTLLHHCLQFKEVKK